MVPSTPVTGRRIEIPFTREMKAAVLSGRKRMTCRFRRYGFRGDHFEVKEGLLSRRGRRFVLTAVNEVPLGDVASSHYAMEGHGSPEEFMRAWMKAYPGRGQEDRMVWAHTFEEVERAGTEGGEK
jgi:hypothetical protein